MSTADLSVAGRLAQVLDHVGFERVHFAASMLTDVAEFAQAYPERMASLTLVCPPRLDPAVLRALGARLVIIAGARSAGGHGASRDDEPAGVGRKAYAEKRKEFHHLLFQ